MPVIAAAVLTRSGKILLSRHYMDVTRIRIEGLLTAFPKLLSSEVNMQHTFVETGALRYVYQPFETLFIVLVTTKNSNIVEDLATLRLIGRLLAENVPLADEETVGAKAFNILFAFDEVVTCGFRENVTIEQVSSILEMHSHEEDVYREDEKKQIADAKVVAKKRAQELAAKRRKEKAERQAVDSKWSEAQEADERDDASQPSAPPPKTTFSDVAEELTEKKVAKAVGGMSLGRARKTDSAAKILQETGTKPSPQRAVEDSARAQPSGDADVVPRREFHIKIEEKISATLNRDGGASSVDIRGDLFVNVMDPAVAAAKLVLSKFDDAFSYKTHPNINKALFTTDHVLLSKDMKPYPVQQSLGVLRWRLQAATGAKLPITVNCWPNETGVSVEFDTEDSTLVLNDVAIRIPLGGAFPTDADCSIGSYEHDSNKSILWWTIPTVDPRNSTGTMDVQLDREVSAGVFFPTKILFTSNKTMSNMSVIEVINASTGTAIPFSSEVSLLAEDYIVS